MIISGDNNKNVKHLYGAYYMPGIILAHLSLLTTP